MLHRSSVHMTSGGLAAMLGEEEEEHPQPQDGDGGDNELAGGLAGSDSSESKRNSSNSSGGSSSRDSRRSSNAPLHHDGLPLAAPLPPQTAMTSPDLDLDRTAANQSIPSSPRSVTSRLFMKTTASDPSTSSASSAKTVSLPIQQQQQQAASSSEARPTSSALASPSSSTGSGQLQRHHSNARHHLRVSTRPSTKRASSYTQGMTSTTPAPVMMGKLNAAPASITPGNLTGTTSLGLAGPTSSSAFTASTSSNSGNTELLYSVPDAYTTTTGESFGLLLQPPPLSPGHRSGHKHASSISLPLTSHDDHLFSHHQHHHHPQSRLHAPSSLRAELLGSTEQEMGAAGPGPTTTLLPPLDHQRLLSANLARLNIENSQQHGSVPFYGGPGMTRGASAPDQYAPDPHASTSAAAAQPPQHYHHQTHVYQQSYRPPSSPVRSRASVELEHHLQTHHLHAASPRPQSSSLPTGPPLSPTSAHRLLKGKMRSRNPSLSSAEPRGALVESSDANDLSTDFDPSEAGHEHEHDVASDAGAREREQAVRETDRLNSARDALGRKMINQYARVADIGRGVHGRVWLCEDTETGEFFAIKSVNRENRKNKSLKRSQAEAEAARRLMEQDDDDEGEDGFRYDAGATTAATTTAPQSDDEGAAVRPHQRLPSFGDRSFDEKMQLNSPPPPRSAALSRKGTNLKRSIVMDEKVRQEIAIMKRVYHDHVVQLREVIDDRRSKKIFMVLEYMPGGQVMWTENDQPTMTVDEARCAFRDVVLGLEYLHYQGIIHRDIKPANLLWTQDRKTVKISDFGVSHVSEALARSSAANPSGGRVGMNDDRALRKTEGSPAFFAPELCAAQEATPVATPINELERTASRPEYFRRISGRSSGNSGNVSPMSILSSTRPQASQRAASALSVMTISPPLSAQQQQAHRVRARERPIVGKGIDVWALGVTLYCLLFGYTPFHEATTEYELYNMIPKKEIAIPPTMGSDRLPTGSGVDKSEAETKDEYAEGREVVHLLSRLLEKDPTKRIELHEVKKHPWVLRNLRDSQGWLAEHDLADTRVLHVTEEEVQHATAERTAPVIPQSNLKASFKRFGEMFGLGGQSFLRRSTRRDRSKSISSTSASITTASAFDGRSEASHSRVASRNPSIVKKKPSTRSTRSGVTGSDEHQGNAADMPSLDANALVSHIMALKRQSTNARAAREAHEAALSVSASSSPPLANFGSQSGHSHVSSNPFSRSLSGESDDTRPQLQQSSTRRPSIVSHLQAPALIQRRISSGASDISSRPSSVADPAAGGQPKPARPSLPALASRPWSNASFVASSSNVASDAEVKGSSGLRGVWKKLRAGRRTPASVSSPQSTKITALGQNSAPPEIQTMRISSREEQDKGDHAGSHQAGPDVVGHTSGLTPQATTPILAHPLLSASALQAKLAAAAPEDRDWEATKRAIQSEEVVSDSSDDLSDDFEDDGDYGEALSPLETGEVTQPSSIGTNSQPIIWADMDRGWQMDPKLPADPLNRFFRRQNSRQPSESGSASASANTSATDMDSTPKAQGKTSHPVDLGNAVRTSARDAPARPPLSRDGSIHKDFTSRVPPPSPGRLSDIVHTGDVADDENDDEEEEEVMIKPRSRLRRETNTSSGLNLSAPRAPIGYCSPLAHPGC